MRVSQKERKRLAQERRMLSGACECQDTHYVTDARTGYLIAVPTAILTKLNVECVHAIRKAERETAPARKHAERMARYNARSFENAMPVAGVRTTKQPLRAPRKKLGVQRGMPRPIVLMPLPEHGDMSVKNAPPARPDDRYSRDAARIAALREISSAY